MLARIAKEAGLRSEDVCSAASARERPTSVAAVERMAVLRETAQLRCSVHGYFIGAFAAERVSLRL